MKQLLVVHGPNLNLLGERSPEIYGRETLEELNVKILAYAETFGLTVKFFQSNSEGALIDFIQENRKWADGMVINPAAYTHTSIALRDAIEGCNIPTVEVHLSKVEEREPFRRHSMISDVCVATFSGFGPESYLKGIEALFRISRHCTK